MEIEVSMFTAWVSVPEQINLVKAMMRLGTARVLKYVIIAIGLLVFGNTLHTVLKFYAKPTLTAFREGGSQGHGPVRSSAIQFVPTSTEVLHIGLVVQSHSDCRYASLQVKSLLMHRHNPLHLHLLTNKRLAMILRTLIDTWHIPYLNVTFYMSDNLPGQLSTSDLRLWLPKLIPESIHTLVIFDSDVLVGSDITALWQEFCVMRKEGKPLGVLSNAQNREPDTRLMLVNVTAVRGIVSIMKEVAVYRIPSIWNLESRCLIHTGPLNCAKVLLFFNHNISDATLEQFLPFNSYRLQSVDQTEPGEIKDSSGLWDWLTSSCADMRRRLTYRVHPYFIEYSYHPRDAADISLVTQLSFDRIHMLIRLLELWKGPVSAAVYLEECQLLQLMEFIHNMPVFQRTNIGLHVVYKKGDFLYPINFLRNIAWNYSTTSYVFLNDIDLMPSVDLYDDLKNALRHTLKVNSVYVVPAFETPIKDLLLPSNKELLQTYMKDDQVSPFKWQYHKLAQKPTNYKKWLRATEPYEVRWKEWYEPYIVVHHNTSRYDERFAGYGENKVSHILELHAQRYRFVVLPNVYVIHYPHKPSRDETKFRGKTTRTVTPTLTNHYYSCMRQIQKEFRKDLKKKYGYSAHSSSSLVPPFVGIVVIVVLLTLVVGVTHSLCRCCCCRTE